jgi:plasmid stabilization system protein ParE
MLRIVVTERAQNSLEEIIDFYLENHSVERATKVLNSIESAFDTIANAPHKFPVCFDIVSPSEAVRQMIVHNTFKVIYRVMPHKIEIIEVFHGSRNPDMLKDIS